MSDKNQSNIGGATPGAPVAGNPAVGPGAAATSPSATAGNASGGGGRTDTSPYARSVTGADTAHMNRDDNDMASRSEGMANEARHRAARAGSATRDGARRAYEWGEQSAESGRRWANETYYDARRYSRKARQGAGEFIDENPLMIGVIGLAVGLAVGALVPMSRSEHRYFGPWRDELRDRGYEYGRDGVRRARHVAEEGYRAGYEEARNRGMTPSKFAENVSDVTRAARDAAAGTAEKEFGDAEEKAADATDRASATATGAPGTKPSGA